MPQRHRPSVPHSGYLSERRLFLPPSSRSCSRAPLNSSLVSLQIYIYFIYIYIPSMIREMLNVPGTSARGPGGKDGCPRNSAVMTTASTMGRSLRQFRNHLLYI